MAEEIDVAQWIVTLAYAENDDDAVGETVLTALIDPETTMVQSTVGPPCAAIPLHALLTALITEMTNGQSDEIVSAAINSMRSLLIALEIQDDIYHREMRAREN